jgi:hypothetical protein
VSDTPYRIKTEASSGAPTVTLEDGERLVSVDVMAGSTDMTLTITAANMETTSVVITVLAGRTWSRNWHTASRGPLFGPGTLTFGNLGTGRYVVETVR